MHGRPVCSSSDQGNVEIISCIPSKFTAWEDLLIMHQALFCRFLYQRTAVLDQYTSSL